MQIKNSLDKTTLCKIGTAFLISATAGAGGGFIAFSAEFLVFLSSNGTNPMNWYIIGSAAFAPFSSAIVASFLQWKKGIDPKLIGEDKN